MNRICLLLGSFLLLISLNLTASGDRSTIMNVLNEYLEMNLEFLEAMKSSNVGAYFELRDEREWFAEDKVYPILNSMAKFICQNEDEEMLDLFLQVMATTKHSFNENPIEKLGELFICQPEFVITRLIAFENNGTLVKQLQLGYDITKRKKQLGNSAELQARITALKT